VLRLDHPARIHQIQLLSHEYKIATKIELYTGLLPPGETSLDRAVMRRLGHLSFDANSASGRVGTFHSRYFAVKTRFS
jgi:centrosomal protein CEP104